MLANWPLIAIRIVESFLFLLIVIGSVVAAIIPIAVAAGFSNFDIANRDNAADAIASIVIGHWMLILYILAIIVSLFLGALTSYAFKAHNVLAALYHGATAPLTVAFLTGIDTHAR